MKKQKFYDIQLNGQSYKIAVAHDEETRAAGLSGLERLGESKGMLFVFPELGRHTMNMRDVKFPLDFVYVNADWSVGETYSRESNSTEDVTPVEEYFFVLEVPFGAIEKTNITKGSTLSPSESLKTFSKGVKKFKHGGTFEVIGTTVYEVKETDIEKENGKLQVLNNEGEIAMNFSSGGAIFSREDTEELLKLKNSKDKEKIAKFMIEVLHRQENQKQAYVKK